MARTSIRKPQDTKTILLVEDDDDLRAELVEYLRTPRLIVVACSCLAEARAQLTEYARGPTALHAIICDVGLPDGSGIDFYVSHAGRTPTSRWILMSGSHDRIYLDGQLEKAHALSAPLVVEKPVPLRTLRGLIDDGPRDR